MKYSAELICVNAPWGKVFKTNFKEESSTQKMIPLKMMKKKKVTAKFFDH